MANKVLTIVIPTYNMEKFISRCLDSLLILNINDVEILVINDGSRDNSSKIAHEYQEKYPLSIKVIDKENGNYGSCINVALSMATGKYFRILDADDYFDNKSFANYVDMLKNIDVDVVMTHCTYVYENKKKIHQIVNAPKFGEVMVLDEYCCNKLAHDFVMHKITYSLEAVRKSKYEHLEGISYTDIEYVLYPLSKAKTIICLDLELCQYNLGRSGQTVSFKHKIQHVDDLKKIITKILNTFVPNELEAVRLLQEKYISGVIGGYYHILLVLQPLDTQSRLLLRSMDCAIENNMPNLLILIDNISSVGIPFIKIWHKYHTALPISKLYKLAYKLFYGLE